MMGKPTHLNESRVRLLLYETKSALDPVVMYSGSAVKKKETIVFHYKKHKGQHNTNIILIQRRRLKLGTKTQTKGCDSRWYNKDKQEGTQGQEQCARLHNHVPAAAPIVQ
ncbi:hypothetical protein PIB30_090028 [Stylosanthes scabra]|uniref:Uncharacterized protein n=1 Tax=Stylosanthes scabra TaxID=79078 RepID=A0ABU6XRZ5_9FABA|nr:hypothetical protein [Stylosanthes scabra]